MSRYIDAEALRKEFEREGELNPCDRLFWGKVLSAIDNAPTVELHLDIWEKIADYEGCDRVQIEQNGKQYEFVKKRKGKWIPVSDRLPVHRDWYLGTFREPNTGFICLPYICDYVGKVTKGTTKEGWILRGFTDIDNACDYHKSLECIAWQPLPEPYKRGDV